MKVVRFQNRSGRIIPVPVSEVELIEIMRLNQDLIPVDTIEVDATEDIDEDTEKANAKIAKSKKEDGFTFYPPFDLLLSKITEKVYDGEEIQEWAKTIEGYEEISLEECNECFIYYRNKQKWLKNNASND